MSELKADHLYYKGELVNGGFGHPENGDGEPCLHYGPSFPHYQFSWRLRAQQTIPAEVVEQTYQEVLRVAYKIEQDEGEKVDIPSKQDIKTQMEWCGFDFEMGLN